MVGSVTALLTYLAVALLKTEEAVGLKESEAEYLNEAYLISQLLGVNPSEGQTVNWRNKRDPFGITARGFHTDVFARDFGSFKPYKRSLKEESGGRRKRELFPESLPQKGEMEIASKREVSNLKNKEISAANNVTPAENEFSKRYFATYRTRSMGTPKRRPSSDFHGDAFTQGFGEFTTMKKRKPMDDFHGNAFTEGFGDFSTMKRRPTDDFNGDIFTDGFGNFATMKKRNFYNNNFYQELVNLNKIRNKQHHGIDRPHLNHNLHTYYEETKNSDFQDKMSAQQIRALEDLLKDRPVNALTHSHTMEKRRPSDDFGGDTFTEGFGDFNTMKKRRPSDDFGGDTFTQGFGDFDTMRKRRPSDDFGGDTFTQGFGDFDTMKKRRPSDDFGGDTFTQGFGDFDTMKKRRPSDDFEGDTFTQGFGDFDTMKKRRPSDDFGGDTFTQGFGDFDTMKKRRPSDDFGGDTFTQGFGDFDTMRKRRPSDDFGGDTFTQGFGDFDTMKKRRPSDDFGGDTFTQGFGDFDTMKKRRPSDDFGGDTFTQGFGDFDTMKKKKDFFHKSTVKTTSQMKKRQISDNNVSTPNPSNNLNKIDDIKPLNDLLSVNKTNGNNSSH